MKNVIIWLSVMLMIVLPNWEKCTEHVETIDPPMENVDPINEFEVSINLIKFGPEAICPYDFQVEKDKVSFRVALVDSWYYLAQYGYRIVDRELRITFFVSIYDSEYSRIQYNEITNVVIPIPSDQYDRIVIEGRRETRRVIYEK